MVFVFVLAENNKQKEASSATKIEENKIKKKVENKVEKEEVQVSIFTESEWHEKDPLGQLPYPITKQQFKKAGDNFLIIEKTHKTESIDFSFQDISVKKEVILEFTGADSILIEESKIHQVCDGKYVEFRKTEGKTNKPVVSFEIEHEILKSGTAKTEISFQFDNCYVYQTSEDEHYYYLSFFNPHELYDKVIVLDPGHGGGDSGTYSSDQKILEKDINMDIAKRVIDYLKQEKNIKVYATRQMDWCPSLEQRIGLANDLNADLFLSIHCNSNEIDDICGVEVLYSELQDDWKKFNSQEFAQICQEAIVAKTALHDRGISPRARYVSVLAYAEVPAALVELGFMSNPSDLSFLRQPEKRQLAAEGIYQGIMQALKETE